MPSVRWRPQSPHVPQPLAGAGHLQRRRSESITDLTRVALRQHHHILTYGTDFDGNVTSRTCGGESVTFGWSGDGRLTGYTIAGGPTVGLFYDAAGRLVRREVNGSPASYFLWDGDDLLAELDGSQYLVAQYSYYPGLDRLHAFNRGGSVSYAQADAEGNVRYLGTNVYNQVRSYVYDESGNLVGGTDWGGLNGIDRARWKGALYLAPEAGLYYMRARWYEPRTGRFLSEDPIGLSGGLNPYIFAGADPVNGADPTGLQGCPFPKVPDGHGGCKDPTVRPIDVRGSPDTRPATAFDFDPYSAGPPNECREYVFGGTRDCSERFAVPEPPRILRAGASCVLPGGVDAEEALGYWAARAAKASSGLDVALSTALGSFAALWTPGNQWKTASTLVVAYGARVIGPFSPRGLPPGVGQIRGRVRFDPPHHGQGWHWDGSLFRGAAAAVGLCR